VDRSTRLALVLGALSVVVSPIGAFLLGLRLMGGTGFDALDALDLVGLTVIAASGLAQLLYLRDRTRLRTINRRTLESLERTEVQLAEAGSRYRLLVEHVPAAVYIDMADDDVTDGGRLAYMSPQIDGILGYRPDEFVGDPELWPSLIHPDDRAAALAAYFDHWKTGRPLRAEYRMIARDGREVWVRDEAFAMPAETMSGRSVSQGLLVDTTDRKRLEAQLLHDALHDPLTGLANRVLFRDHVERALVRRRRSRTSAAILFLDLDDFKLVNDSRGHGAGDRVLVEIGRRLGEAIRADDIAARQGGDEFTILLARVHGIAEAVEAAERLLEELRAPIDLDGQSVVIGGSIGIAMAGGRDTVADDLLAHADAAMYAAKAAGKGRQAVFDPSMRVRAWSRLEEEADVRFGRPHLVGPPGPEAEPLSEAG
jgi:diguanylate cyclase (GGDEF)-like protein/PAS domain S-box-containing protein